MYPPVPRQARGLADRPISNVDNLDWDGTHVRKGLSTIRLFAMMRLFASMGTNVHRQRAPLDEALAATLLVTSIRSLLCVYAMMSLQI